jgi:NAD(P)-dependent dehydrogenase (short-subunit alcohol dehydrogenase family)
MGRLDNKIAVVTGGASNPSLGRSMSIAFAREGAKVILTDIDVEVEKKLKMKF